MEIILKNMEQMITPNYKNGSIVNLASSIARRFGLNTSYGWLKELDKDFLDSKNIVLLILDGLGEDVLKENISKTILEKYKRRPITSVFPSSTEAAISSILTGVAPLQHGMIGWSLFIKEVGTLIDVLPFVYTHGGIDFRISDRSFKEFFPVKTIFEGINAKSFAVVPDILRGIPINDSLFSGVRGINYFKRNRGMFQILRKILKKRGEKYVYVYNHLIDKWSHEKGKWHRETTRIVKELIREICLFIKNMEKDTTLIISSDHGFIDVEKYVYMLGNKKELLNLLSVPPFGEGSVRYIHLKNGKEEEFLEYYEKKLEKYSYLYSGKEFIKKGLLGHGVPRKETLEFIGDYVLIAKDRYKLSTRHKKDIETELIGHHGGLTREEMLCPLIVVKK
ncbi:alkaline phosphatase family protein [Candidatus Woesearchaeota archaeon]|nr:alkaline phosphatase family protein [Candidatus Woesearchaeota archaeon]